MEIYELGSAAVTLHGFVFCSVMTVQLDNLPVFLYITFKGRC